jgi:excisionase family DNA binding protein
VSGLTRLVLEELGPAELRELAERLAPYLPTPEARRGGWLSSREAAEYLAVSLDTIQDKTAKREIPFRQPGGPGGRCYYLAAELDRARDSGAI